MNTQKDHFQELSEIRSMMERSSKFLFLSGVAGLFAGLYALIGVYFAITYYKFNPDVIFYDYTTGDPFQVILLGAMVLIASIATALLFSSRKAKKAGDKIWNPSSRRLLGHVSVPLLVGGILVLTFFNEMLFGLMAPLTLIFYGLALFIAGNFSLTELKVMGILQMMLGILSLWMIPFSMLIWGFGFGILHIGYGLLVFMKYER